MIPSIKSVPELSSDNMCVKTTMALMMAVDKEETRNRLDGLNQTVDSLWYPLTTGLSIISLLLQQCSEMTIGDSKCVHCLVRNSHLGQLPGFDTYL